MIKQFRNAAAANHHHCRFLHYSLLLRRAYAVILFAGFIKGDTSTPSKVGACISYNATGFPHLNLQWEDSGIDQITDIKMYYSVNGRNELNITIPYQGTNNITDITLSNVHYNDNISVQIVMQNATTMTRRSNRSLIRANPLYSINGFYINNNSSDLAIVCELACRTKIIKGCNVSLLQESKAISMQSDELNGTSEKISGQISIVIFNNISSNKSVTYQASALTDASITEFGEQLLGSVSRQVSINSTSGTTTIVSSQTHAASSTVIDATASSLTTSSTTAMVNTGTPSAPLPDSHSSENMITIIIVIGVVAIVIVAATIMVILIVIVRKVRNNKHNNSEHLKEKSLKIDEATLPDLIRARMVTIKSEAGNVPEPYEQVDNTSDKLFRKMQPPLNPQYEAHEFKVNGENITYLSSTNAHHPSDYNKLIYSKSEEDIALPVPNKQNYSQLQLQTRNYDEVYLDDQTAEPETMHHEYASLKFGNNESSS